MLTGSGRPAATRRGTGSPLLRGASWGRLRRAPGRSGRRGGSRRSARCGCFWCKRNASGFLSRGAQTGVAPLLAACGGLSCARPALLRPACSWTLSMRSERAGRHTRLKLRPGSAPEPSCRGKQPSGAVDTEEPPPRRGRSEARQLGSNPKNTLALAKKRAPCHARCEASGAPQHPHTCTICSLKGAAGAIGAADHPQARCTRASSARVKLCTCRRSRTTSQETREASHKAVPRCCSARRRAG